ncbi:hypothetical protein C8Q80DRAFT_1255662 [Daedaleopsis nitida]|nr:hypothetical protein C8Q80DRAFT_1255662 [Daedaleopsis nitida]
MPARVSFLSARSVETVRLQKFVLFLRVGTRLMSVLWASVYVVHLIDKSRHIVSPGATPMCMLKPDHQSESR